MRAETVIAQIHQLQQQGKLSLRQGMNLLLAWNAIQNLGYMIFVTKENAKELARDALADINRPIFTESITQLEFEILESLELL